MYFGSVAIDMNHVGVYACGRERFCNHLFLARRMYSVEPFTKSGANIAAEGRQLFVLCPQKLCAQPRIARD
jgi:hypothetical protein